MAKHLGNFSAVIFLLKNLIRRLFGRLPEFYSMPAKRQFRSVYLRLFRAALFVGILTIIHFKHREWAGDIALHRTTGGNIPVEMVRDFFPSAATLKNGTVLDANGNELGTVVQTSPESDSIVGYSGPTNSLIALGPDGAVLGTRIISTGDTQEHAEKIKTDPTFLSALNGSHWADLKDAPAHVDGVSGATLTSRAIVAGIARRAGGDSRSFLFVKPLTLTEAQSFFPNIRTLDQIIRTSPHSDRLIGYGGPSDILIALEPNLDTISGIAVRESFDTQNYVDDITADTWFMDGFKGKMLSQIASRMPADDDIEGVSGATMTSMTIADAVYQTARIRSQTNTALERQIFTLADITSILIVTAALLIAFTRLRGNKPLRIAFHLLLVGYLGFVNGHLISQALIVGWAQNGIAWQLAPGLLALTAAALLIPLLTKRQIYCHHICPHGAAQQLLRNLLPKKWHWSPPARLAKILSLIPFLLIAAVLLIAMRHLSIPISSLEPFDAYLITIAGMATIAIAVIGLIASLFIPMAYCRYGCPTGAVLDFLWAHGRHDHLTRRDTAAVLLLLLALLLAL